MNGDSPKGTVFDISDLEKKEDNADKLVALQKRDHRATMKLSSLDDTIKNITHNASILSSFKSPFTKFENIADKLSSSFGYVENLRRTFERDWRRDLGFSAYEDAVRSAQSWFRLEKESRLAVAPMCDAISAATRMQVTWRDSIAEVARMQESWRDSIKFAALSDSIADTARLHSDLWSSVAHNHIDDFISGFGGIERVKSWTDFGDSISKMVGYYNDLPLNTMALELSAMRVVMAQDVFDIGHIQKVVEEKLEESGLTRGAFVSQHTLDKLIEEIRNIKEPILQKVVWNFIFPLIIAMISLFIAPQIKEFSKQFFSKNRAAAIGYIKKEAPKLVKEKTILKRLRFVTASSLNVRERNKKDSRKVGTLYFGDVVRIIEKRRNWTLVEWASEDKDVVVRGWIFTRYIKKFNY